MGFFNEGAGNHRTVLQHVLQVYQIAVVHMLGVIIRIVEMDNARFMSLHNFLRQQNAACNVFRYLARHIVPLHGVYRGVFVGVFLLHFLVVALNEA